MTRYTSTASKRIRTIAQLLTVVMTAVIVAIIACSGEQPPPTHRPQTDDRSQIQTIEAMASEITALQTKVEESGETAEDYREDRVQPPATAVQTATEEPTAPPTPAKAVIPTPSSTDICGRSPTLQKEILITLRSPSCSIINEAELYRIQCFTNLYGDCEKPKWDWGEGGPRPGDFAGLVNLKELQITWYSTIEPGAFQGARIKNMEISGATLTEGWAEGMLGLETLNITGGQIPPLGGEALATLKTLNIEITGKFPQLAGDELDTLTALEELRLSGYLFPAGTNINEIPKKADPALEYEIPAELLRNNANLKELSINIGGHRYESSNYRLVVAQNMVEHLNDLEAIGINRAVVQNRQEGAPPLLLASNSPLKKYLTVPERIPENPHLNHQMMAIQYWQSWQNGQAVNVSSK